MSIRKSILLGALMTCGAALAAVAATPGTASQPTAPAAHFRHSEMLANVSFMHAIHQLNLMPEQRTTIQGYLQAAHQQAKENTASRVDMSVLANPGDPNYAAAVATAKTNAANRIQKQSDLETQVYDVLTSEQRAKLPQVLADMSAKRVQHHADKQTRHKPAPATAG